jgi:hypothetical protein
MELNVEDDITRFLGFHINHNENEMVTLLQTGLIDIPSPSSPLQQLILELQESQSQS